MDRVLIVDDDISITESLKFALRKEYELFFAYNTKEALEHYNSQDIDVVLLDLNLGSENGMDLFYKLKEINENVVVIIITAYGTIKSSIEAIQSGVFQYLTKPIDYGELRFNIEKGVRTKALYNKIYQLEEENLKVYQNMGIISKSEKMREILELVDKIKDIDTNVLITGESGTGKSAIAKAIHKMGNRSSGRFNTINCAAIPKELLESELFGHKKGSFTGAIRDKKGYFALSDKGTLFLDEIGDMDISLQGKLLHAIQEKKVLPVGSEQEIDIDVRLIAATNKDLEEMIKNNEFREDLYYRLNVINIHLPPLRERTEDIEVLVNYFIEKYSAMLDKEILGFEYEFLEILKQREFSGNIRELENIIERAIALSDSKVLNQNDLSGYLKELESSEDVKKSSGKLIPVFVGDSLKEIERRVIETTYKEQGYNQKKTAEILGITDRTIRNKLKEYEEK